MTMRVATFAMSDRSLTASLHTQAKLAAQQTQLASGLVSTDFGGLGSSAGRVVDLQVSIARANSSAAAGQVANGRVQAMYDACSSMTDILTSLRAALSAVTADGDATSTGLTATATEALSEFAAALNTQFEGRYLFAGSRTDTKPVDLTDYPSTSASSAAWTGYYQGDGELAKVQLSADQTVQYGVTADNPAMEQALRAISMIVDAPSGLDEATVSEATALVLAAIDGVIAIQSRLSVQSASIERAIADRQDYADFAATLATDLTAVDVAALTATMSSYEAQLEASYAAIAKIQGFSLLDYLR